jgi:hypothetical protein
MFDKIKQLFNKPKAAPEAAEEDIVNPCCEQPNVHIAYRGRSDDRLYCSYNRTWQEVQFFQPYGLRVFCAECRRRVY